MRALAAGGISVFDVNAAAAPADTLFGHPRGLATLFFTEMWERFTYYGMRAILILFMVTGVAEGGLGIADRTASSIYGLFVAGSYLLSLLGGWWLPVIGIAATVGSVSVLALTRTIVIDPAPLAAATTGTERHRVYVMLALFIASTVYYAGQEQAGTSLTLFAERYTERRMFGWEIPAGIFQGVSSFYIILFAPLFSALWIALGRRGKDLSIPVKFAIGLILKIFKWGR
jgi:dipeptide/tripeptide permease